MQRLCALFVVTLGVLSSTPLLSSFAKLPPESALDFHCRTKLGFSRNQKLEAAPLFQLRRCKTLFLKQYENEQIFDRRMQREDQYFWRRWEIGQKVLRESRRSLHERLQQQQRRREAFYKDVPLELRREILLAERAERRSAILQYERELDLTRIKKEQEYQEALKLCSYYKGLKRETCMRAHLH